MTGTVTLPTWIFVVLLVFALWALLERLLVPGVRWYLRRKVNRVIREINTRLNVELPQFKLARRQALIDRLFHDPKVQDAIARECGEKGLPRAVVAARVDRYAREIVPAFNAYFYFGAGYRLGKALAKLLYRVRLGYTDTQAIAAVNFLELVNRARPSAFLARTPDVFVLGVTRQPTLAALGAGHGGSGEATV